MTLTTNAAKILHQATEQPLTIKIMIRCSRDFTKLVERIAAQTRFEEEQRAARAAERTCPEGETGGDSSAESGGRKPKGLVWEVRKLLFIVISVCVVCGVGRRSSPL